MASADLEWDVIGCVMYDPSILPAVLRRAHPADFQHTRAQNVFHAIVRVHEAGERPDAFRVCAELERQGADKRDVLEAFNADHHRTVASNAPNTARLIRADALQRRLRAFGSALAHEPMQGEPSAWIAKAEVELRRLGDSVETGRSVLAGEVVDMLLDSIDADTDLTPTLPTRLAPVDRMLGGGLQQGRLYVVGARPGVGKTALLCNVTLRTLAQGKRVLFASLEMSPLEILQRLMADHANVGQDVLRQPARAVELAGVASEWPLEIMSNPLTVADIGARARELRGSLGLVVVDYLQLLSPTTRNENRTTEVGEISRSLKVLSGEIHVPILTAAQLNRSPDTGPKQRRPRLSDLRESGSIENDADVVVLLHREWSTNPYEATAIVAKNRHGEAGECELVFRPSIGRFEVAA